jgi:hypothetical protein
MSCCVRTKRGAFDYARETTYGDGGGGNPSYNTTRIKDIDVGDMGKAYEAANDIVAVDIEDQGRFVDQPSTLKVTTEMHGVISVDPDTKVADPGGLSGHWPTDVISAALGPVRYSGMGVIKTGSTATVVKLDTGGGATFDGGDLLWTYDANDNLMMGRVKSVSTDDLTMTWALPATPKTGAVAVGGHHIPKTATVGSIACRWQGENYDDSRYWDGVALEALSLKAEPRKLVDLVASLYAAQVRGPQFDDDHAALTQPTYSFPVPIQALGGGLQIVPITAGTYGTPITVQGGFEIEFGLENSAVDGVWGSNPNGVAGYCNLGRKIRIKLQPCFKQPGTPGSGAAGEGAYWHSAFEDGSTFGLAGWIGVGMNAFGFVAPVSFQVVYPKDADQSGRLVLDLEFGLGSYTGDGGTGEGKDASFVCGFPAGTVAP